ncbi:unnamed protein product [Owenia fusiformis]|uniref:unspecific monooxygenase n=1 Tax=Owenia fusiformis TaxID=6347 RepID=A0A8J1UD35_OWEFU|nr:unnamed protein product [Owenia fusiformis]
MIWEVAAILLGFIFLKYIWDHRIGRRRCKIAGPRGLPLIGNALEFMQIFPFDQFTFWRQKYGDIFKIQLLNKDIVILNGDAVYDALVGQSDDFSGRPDIPRLQLFNDCEDIATRNPDNKWKDYRKICHQGLRQFGKGVAHIEKITMHEIEDCIAKFEAQNGAFNPNIDIYRSVTNILMIMILGEKLDSSDPLIDKLAQCQETLDQAFGPKYLSLDIIPWIRYIPGVKTFSGFKDSVASVHKVFSDIIKERKMQLLDGQDKAEGILDMLLATQEERKGTDKNISDKTMNGLIQDMVIPGINTTSAALKSMLAYLVVHPEIQQTIQQEIDSVLGNRCPSIKDRSSMPYTDAFLLESLRYMSHLPIGIPHAAIRDVTIKGHFIPKGTQVWLYLFGLHHDDRFFPDPWSFTPQRFLDKDGGLIPPDERKLLLPFGAGRRVCLGEQLARIRMFLFITTFLQKYTFLPETPDNLPDCDIKNGTMGAVMNLKDYNIRLERRK